MARCLKCLLFVLNLLIWLGGAVLLGVSVWAVTQDTQFQHVTGNLIVTGCFIGLASFLFILGFIGTCGILLGNICLLKTYFTFIMLLFLMEIGLSIFLYGERRNIEGFVKENWNSTTDETRILIQDKLECCSMNPVLTSHTSSSHTSCFKDNSTRHEDCYNKLTGWFEENWIILGSTASVLALFQIFILIGSCRLIFVIEKASRFPKRTQVVPVDTTDGTEMGVTPAKEPVAPRTGVKRAPPPERGEPSAPPAKKPIDRTDSINRKDWAKNNPRQQIHQKRPKKTSIQK